MNRESVKIHQIHSVTYQIDIVGAQNWKNKLHRDSPKKQIKIEYKKKGSIPKNKMRRE